MSLYDQIDQVVLEPELATRISKDLPTDSVSCKTVDELRTSIGNPNVESETYNIFQQNILSNRSMLAQALVQTPDGLRAVRESMAFGYRLPSPAKTLAERIKYVSQLVAASLQNDVKLTAEINCELDGLIRTVFLKHGIYCTLNKSNKATHHQHF